MRRGAVFFCALSVFLGAAFASASEHREPESVVFAHGLGISAGVYETLVPLKKVFRDGGYEVRVAHTPAAGSLDERAATLNEEIRRLVPQGRFHLVGHSMGGLDARLAVHRFGLGERCLSVTTIATPHRGSSVADFVVDHLGEVNRDGGLARIALRLFGGEIEAARALTTRSMVEFNRRVIDDPRVRYFSLAFFIPEPASEHSRVPWLWPLHGLIEARGGGPNDAMVSIGSAEWGELLGVFPGDHYSETAPVPFKDGIDYRDVFGRILAKIREI